MGKGNVNAKQQKRFQDWIMEYHTLLMCQHSQITFSGIHSEMTDIFLIAGPQTMISSVAIRTDACKRLE